MGESRYFQAGDPRNYAPDHQARPVYSYHPEPVMSAYAPQYGAEMQPGWMQTPASPASTPQWSAAPQQGTAAAPSQGAVPPDAEAPVRAAQTSKVMHGFGAVLSVALMVGAAGWTWQMMQRDVAGVPVVRALEGPLRVAPDNPGGRQAAHQGLSINQLAGARDDMAREQIVLAPPPLDLAQEDLTRTPAPEADAQRATGLAEQPIPVALQQDIDSPSQQAPALGMNAPTRRAVARSPRPPARDPAQVRSSTTQMAALPTSRSDAAPSLASDLADSVADSVARGLSGVRERDIDPATIGPGTRLVQLGAYDDMAAARAAWEALERRFSPLLDDRGRVIEAAHSGGSVFYRLRAHGFEDERDARRFCAALVDQQIDCIPVLIR